LKIDNKPRFFSLDENQLNADDIDSYLKQHYNKHEKIIFFGLILILSQVSLDVSYAQVKKPNAREIEAIKIGYITPKT
jgi:hypothetical protein